MDGNLVAKKSDLTRRLLINVAFLIPYIWLLVVTVSTYGTHQKPDVLVPLLLSLPWGFMGYRWIARDVLGESFMHVSVDFRQYFWVVFLGSLFCAMMGMILLPIMIAVQIIRLQLLNRIIRNQS